MLHWKKNSRKKLTLRKNRIRNGKAIAYPLSSMKNSNKTIKRIGKKRKDKGNL